ncbi:von Willebrand factor type A domain-containing protein [Chaetomium tenue]|uniref:von Willebrand factor type A domain-containing protein n=1 Tax=Chaetomium tenue TaxID=1854479 RepID=A0ACB7P326_9PEZI|nr:von Willebrand factor type A domain-containing protein [Chaetomium globosum]
MAYNTHICGLYYLVPGQRRPERKYLPQLSLSANTKIVSSTSRTTLTQTFVNPRSEVIPELRYTFPLYDGVSVVGFVCTINGERVIRGVVKERAEARKTYQAAIDRGETAGLLEQLPAASDVFTTTVGNVPANATLKVEISYLGELKQDAEVDGIRFTIPTGIAPRYGNYPGELLSSPVDTKGGISIVVDVEMPDGSNVKNVQSPSHPISVTLGNTSAGAASGADMSLQKASATLALSTTELGNDFILQVVATNTGNPIAVLEQHPTLDNHRALMATLVPKFNLPSAKPEIVFLCDRSGSMEGSNMKHLKTALHLFLKSLPVGVKFNICSFGSSHEFLFGNKSQTYDQSSLEKASRYVDGFSANFGGTDIYRPMEDVISRRYADMDLEVFLLTDGEIWDQRELFELLNKKVAESKGKIRVFTLGIGSDVSHALVEGVAAASNGFSQSVGDNEKMNTKVVRMLKASLMPHVNDYTLEVKYANDVPNNATDEDFEIVEKVMDGMTIDVREVEKEEAPKKPTSLFDEAADPDVEMLDSSLNASAGGKYSHVPPVSEPKFLQAPFLIPALFPFNRTTVYLLLSPETAQKQPKSVILRGTSSHGPVELEIPVTVLAEKSETIHQLAARKAVKELEEGRGWIYHAKDGAGALLKDQYPGRFSDMVEREAVRLGVTYQVGGKWCSFVAVEDGQNPDDLPARPPTPESRPEGSRVSGRGFGTPYSSTLSSFTRNRSLPSRKTATYSAAPPPPPPPAPRRGGAMLMSCSPVLSPSTHSVEDDSDDDMGFGLMDDGPAVPVSGATQAMQMQASAASHYPENDSDDAEGFGLFDDGPSVPEPEVGNKWGCVLMDDGGDDGYGAEKRKPAVRGDDVLSSLVGLQAFDGAWRWDELVLVLPMLGLDNEEGGKGVVLAKKAAADGLGGASDVFATALVLAFLEGVMADRQEEWEMLADKARLWLEVALVDRREMRSVDAFCGEVKALWEREQVVGGW